MNISARCEYGCRAVLELARHKRSGDPISAATIAERTNVPEKYLVHIMLQLKREGIVNSIRGAQGGYTLGRPASEITLLDVVRAIEGPVLNPLPVNETTPPELALAWRESASAVEEVLRSVTFQAIADRASKTEMYYI